ncbi:hypothetical protein XA68_12685 [Ophiocordyceps unilateralis]|uniref:Small ribosomal subunit protein mS29 n=1 Tax=Ophiocordyceps unilateralis TaxID=268505 RepID=A0A2A9PE50_OPHUN|nr:hypothetical protein XA68_12685 [Ophiocordyceps unilateralis]
MATAGLLFRSLTRPSTAAAQRRTTAAAFSSTPARRAVNPPAASERKSNPTKQKKTYKKTSLLDAVPVKKPAPGERKAFRVRIQTSNNNALPIRGSERMAAKTLVDDASAGRMFGIPDTIVDRLRILRAFKPTQSWGLFHHPHVLVREKTVELARRLDASCQDGGETLRCVLTGYRLTGKSLLLLQAMCHAMLNNWVVINIPEGQELTNGNTEYAPIPDTDPMQFTQPLYTLQLLSTILQVNEKVLNTLPLLLEWPDLGPFSSQATIADLLRSTKETDYAWIAFQAFWKEMCQPGRPPILFSLDGLAHVNTVSDYRDPSFIPVHAHELALVRVFLDALSGKTKLPNGGAIIAATSESNTPLHPSQELVLSQIEATQAQTEPPRRDPYQRRYDDRAYDVLKSTFVLRVPSVSKDEGRALMEYWAASGVVKDVVDTHTVSEKWALGGHGVLGEMEKVALLTLRL